MRKQIILLILVSLSFTSCLKELDASGFIYSKARVNERFQQSMEWNHLHPYPVVYTLNDDYKLLIASDIHVGANETNNNFQKVLDRASKNDIDAAAYVGDLATGNIEHTQQFKEMIYASKTNSFPIIGNHDLYFDGWSGFKETFGTSVYCFIVKSPSKQDLYLCLDSASGTFGDDQLDWLKNMLKNARNKYDKCVVLTHSNFSRIHHTASTSPITEELLVVMDLFEEYNINLVITGHDHLRDIQKLGNIDYIILDAIRDDAPSKSYMLLKKEGSQLKYEFSDLD